MSTKRRYVRAGFTWIEALVIIAILVVAGGLLWRWRVRLLVSRQRELEHLVADRTAEPRNGWKSYRRPA